VSELTPSRADARSWARQSLRGYVVTMTTPFDEQLDVDEDALRRNVARVLTLPEVGGLYVGSVHQEFMSLTLEERKRVAEAVIAETDRRVPVMVNVTGNSTRDVAELADHAQGAGADLLMLWPPTFGHRTWNGVRAFFDEVLDGVEVPVCTYATGFSEHGFQLTPEMVEELCVHRQICAVKDASFNVAQYVAMLERVGSELVISCPAEEYWFYGYQLFGPASAAPVLLGTSRPLFLQNAERPILAEFFRAAVNGDSAAPQQLRRILHIEHKLTGQFHAKGQHNVALVKALSALQGFDSGRTRPPIETLSADGLAPFRQVLDDAGLLAQLAYASDSP
jgi:4-hydroxy-tetrahydrodipicolinate synthase